MIANSCCRYSGKPLSFLASLLVLIVVARLFGRLFARHGQSELIGEILAGILLGPAILNLIEPSPALAGISELAVFMIILTAGLEMRFADIMDAMRGRGMLLALISFVVPFTSGIAIGAAFDFDVMRMILLGLCISITALPVTVKLLDSMGILHTRIARHALATAVINDVAAWFILGIVLNMPQQMTMGDAAGTVALSTAKLLVLILAILSLNKLLKWLDQRKLSNQAIPESLILYFGPEALFGIVVVFVLVFGTLSELLGFHFIIGAFFAALFIDKQHFLASQYDDLHGTLASVTNGFLAPVFFAYLGLEFQVKTLDEVSFPVVVIVVSILSKLLSGWIGGQLVGMPHREAIGLGCVLNGRGIMELVVAGIAYHKGFIGPTMFSTLVLMGILTTFLTPILFKRAFPADKLNSYIKSGA